MTLANLTVPVWTRCGFCDHNDFYMMWLSNILTLSVLYKGYFSSTSSILNLISTFFISSVLISVERQLLHAPYTGQGQLLLIFIKAV